MENTKPAAGQGATEVDPVCGMKVNPATAKFSHEHAGKNYFFCCAGCREKFTADPEKVLSSPPKKMGTGLVSLGMTPAGIAHAATSKAAPVAQERARRDERTYVCPMCPEVRQVGPGPCPSCGMALEPESPALPATKTEYTCPMHPEIVRSEPGSCPICGMALEPRTITLEEENPELRDMTRRFWVSLALTAPLMAIAMGSMLWPHALVGGISFYRPDKTTVTPWNSILPWLELLLATPVVLWGGWPFFQRGWASIVNRSTNMFTLIAMGTGCLLYTSPSPRDS